MIAVISISKSVKKEQITEEKAFQMASILFDEGLGSFERCLKIVQGVRGNIDEARDVLTKLTF
jgi:hypothetical protein